MADILPLRDNVSSRLDNSKVIELLEKTLGEARRGEVSAVAICIVRPGGNLANDWQSCDDNAFHLLAALNYLEYDMIMASQRVAAERQEGA